LYRALYTLAIGEEEHGLTEMQKILAQDKPPVSFVRFLLEDGKILAQSSKPPSGIEKMLEILQAAIHETLSSLTRAD
jgi:hypothetical protein